jgi:heat shock protein HtpX
MKLLDKRELRAVLSHEIGHVRNRDTLIMTVTATLASAIMMLAYMARWGAILGGFSRDRENGGSLISLIAISIVGPLAALIVQMAISRSREYAADAFGARISQDPDSLARALEDLSRYSRGSRIQVQPQTAHLFIVNPFSRGFLSNLFSTHPPVEERVKRLRGMV